MRLTLVRHAEVEESFRGKYNGHNDIGLSQKGVKQAKELCDKLNSIEFDTVFCSDLRRAKETARYLKKEIIYTDKLREKSWGRHEGLSFDEIVIKEKVQYTDFLTWIDTLDGEPYKEYIKRVEEFFFSFLPSQNKQNILIVTHAGVIRILLSILRKISLEEAFCIKIDYGELIVENI